MLFAPLAVACALGIPGPTPPPPHLEPLAAEVWVAEEAHALEHLRADRLECLIDLNGPYREPAKPRPAPSPSAGGSSRSTAGVEQWRDLAAAHPWPVDQVLSVMACESGGDPGAISDTDDWGLMQIHRPLWEFQYGPAESWLNPATNLAVAYAIWIDQPGDPEAWPWWSCKP